VLYCALAVVFLLSLFALCFSNAVKLSSLSLFHFDTPRCPHTLCSHLASRSYVWDSPDLTARLEEAVGKSMSRQDLHLLAVDTDTGILAGYAFLWSAQDPIPELGLAVADAYQGIGLGTSLLLLLEAMARSTGRVAIELTTMQGNDAAYRTYLNAGYALLGIIRNPVGVDVTAAFRGEVKATSFCDERSMVRILTSDKDEQARVLASMAAKRKRAAEMFGTPTM
jgi:ribosomal protein S18 acetylase RimI-like enzyme